MRRFTVEVTARRLEYVFDTVLSRNGEAPPPANGRETVILASRE
jgi:hypothetical protein